MQKCRTGELQVESKLLLDCIDNDTCCPFGQLSSRFRLHNAGRTRRRSACTRRRAAWRHFTLQILSNTQPRADNVRESRSDVSFCIELALTSSFKRKRSGLLEKIRRRDTCVVLRSSNEFGRELTVGHCQHDPS